MRDETTSDAATVLSPNQGGGKRFRKPPLNQASEGAYRSRTGGTFRNDGETESAGLQGKRQERTASGVTPPEERFWRLVTIAEDGSCWLWDGALTPDGYGRFKIGGRVLAAAHRWAYEHFVGVIPDGLQLDHLCRNRRCVNPAHLEPVTNRENTIRGLEARGIPIGHRRRKAEAAPATEGKAI